MNKYKTYEELKEELGDKFEEYMYEANIELLKKIDKVIKIFEECKMLFPHEFSWEEQVDNALQTLKGEPNNE